MQSGIFPPRREGDRRRGGGLCEGKNTTTINGGEELMRTEHDSIGSINLPDDAYYGVQSMRAKENFPMTGRLMHPYMVDSLVIIK